MNPSAGERVNNPVNEADDDSCCNLNLTTAELEKPVIVRAHMVIILSGNSLVVWL